MDLFQVIRDLVNSSDQAGCDPELTMVEAHGYVPRNIGHRWRRLHPLDHSSFFRRSL